MAPKARTPEADLDAIFAILCQNINDVPITGINWERARQIMTGLGYNFSKDAINQRWSKVLNKNAKQRVNQGMSNAINGANGAPATPTSARGKRSRPAPSSGARANQATAQMARAARAVDDGGDDSENDLDVKPRPAKRQVPAGGVAAGLNGQKIDLTNDSEEIQFAQNIDQTPVKTEIKDGEDEKTIKSALIHDAREQYLRNRSCTLAPSVTRAFVKVKKQEVDPSDSDAQGYLDGEV
ncbi:hypothetical protein CcaCcLH18_01578 [Colletotrichum camelliae]|nr:hypothetical protein CcaCcLH18_01578 [Colletotrichum camelliae]